MQRGFSVSTERAWDRERCRLEAEAQDGPRRVYVSPRLVRYGDVRDVTLGTSGGVGESGNETLFRAP